MKKIILLASLILSVGCSKPNNSAVDSALARDLTNAAQFDSVKVTSNLEQNKLNVSPGASTPVKTRVVYRDRPVYRTSNTRSSGTTSTQTTVQKNTKRDAAIGAAAGAVLGAVTSKDKVKGAVIGGVAGAVLGGVIGNNVDKKVIRK